MKTHTLLLSSFPTLFSTLGFLALVLSSCKPGPTPPPEASAENTQVTISSDLPWSERMAQSIMLRNPEAWMTDFREEPRWTYTNGLVLSAILKVGEASGKDKYVDYAKSYADTLISATGEIRDYHFHDFNIDNVNPGKLVFSLYKITGDERYKVVLNTLRRQLQWQPRTTEGGFWHKLIYPWQMWLDGLYMGSPFYAEYGQYFNEPTAFDDVARQFILMEKNARDPQTGLLYHGWDESHSQRWANPETGQSPCFWGRAMGWYLMALTDALAFFPEDHPKRAELEAILLRSAEAVAKYQDPQTGLWYQVLNQGDRAGNYLEATASSMFVYAFCKGTAAGYLPQSFQAKAEKGYQGILDNLLEVTPTGEVHLNQCCAVAGLGGKPYRDGTYEYYINEQVRSNDAKGTGPFILASLEFEKQGLDFQQKTAMKTDSQISKTH